MIGQTNILYTFVVMTYQDALDYLLNTLPMFQNIGAPAYKKDMGNIHKICQYLNNPQQHFKSIHVAGTNGKGSTSHFLASILHEHGLKTGLYTSPHLIRFNERIKCNGIEITPDFVTQFVEKHISFFKTLDASFFEISVAMAFSYFAEKKMDIAVIETGMGGRLDSTNILTPTLSVITQIGWDHSQFLGNSLKEIAAEKAGIIKKKTPVVIFERQEEVQDVFMQKANLEDAPCLFADDVYELQSYQIITEDNTPYLQAEFLHWITDEKINVVSGLTGLYQLRNLAGVLTVVDELEENEIVCIDRDAVLGGIKNVILNTKLMGRWQQVHQQPAIVLDIAHNEPGLKAVWEQLQSVSYQKLRMVVSVVKDKDIDAMLALLPKEAKYYFTQSSVLRSLDEKSLQEKAKSFDLIGHSYHNPSLALSAALNESHPEDIILVCGSAFVVGDILQNPPNFLAI